MAENTETATKAVGVWAIKNLIIPRIEPDILINYLTADYLNDIIEKCLPVCPSAGETVIKYLKFHGNISKDKGKYRFRFTLYFKSGDKYSTQRSGFCAQEEALRAKEQVITELVTNRFVAFDHTVSELFDYWLYMPLLLSITLGTRISEIIGIKYTDIDYTAQVVFIKRQLGRSMEEDTDFLVSSPLETKTLKIFTI